VSNSRFDRGLPRAADDRDQLSAREVLNLLRDHLSEFAAIAAVMIGLAVAYAFLADPLYSGDVLLRLDAPEPNALGIASENQVYQPPAAPSPSGEIAVMQSRSVIEPVILRYQFDITITPRSFPILGAIASEFATSGKPARAWLGLDSFAWGGEQIKIASLHVPPALEDESLELVSLANNEYELRGPSGEHLLSGFVGEPASSSGVTITVTQLVARPGTTFNVIRWNPIDAYNQFLRRMKVIDKAKDTGVIEIAYMNHSPAMAAEVANALAQQYVALAIASRQRDDTATLAFINKELPRLNSQLKRAEQALNEYRNSASSLQPTAEAQAYLQGGIDIQRQIATLQLQRTQLLERYQPDSRWVRNVDSQLADLMRANQAFEARFADMPTSERRNADLARDARVAEAVYLGMQNKAEQLSVRRASTSGGVHIVDDALRPHRPVKPNRLLVISAGVVLGLIAGTAFVFVRHHVMTGVTDPLFVEQGMSVPVLGKVLFSANQARLDEEIRAVMTTRMPGEAHGASANQEEAAAARLSGDASEAVLLGNGPIRVLAARFPDDQSVEALRGVRTTLNRGVAQAANNVVMFAGAAPSAGKSFAAANLAVLQAEIGSRVLLIDADMRRGRLAYFFGQYNRRGLSEVLTGDKEPRDVIRSVGIDGLSFMSCGCYPRNPAELLMGDRFKEVLRRLGLAFDLVIVDTPPLLAVADAAIVANEAGVTVLVVRSGMQTEEEIAETVKKLQDANARLMGAVFNAIPLRRSNRGYAYAMGYKTLDLIEHRS
jgi:tyrosine-protein kinase Etk/Wzc